MAWIATALLALLCVGILAHGLAVRGRFYGFPFLAAGMFVTFVLPQAPGILNDYFVPHDIMAPALFFSALCLAMCWAGWAIGTRSSPTWDLMLDEGRLLKAAALLSVVGAYFFYKLGALPDEQRLRGFLTGAAVAYLFFAKLLTYGLAIAVLCYARRPSKLALGIILFDLIFYFDRIVLAGRRSDLSELLLIFALAFWFQRRWAAPRMAVLAGLCFAMVGLLGAGEYRESVHYNTERDWSAVLDIDLEANWNKLLREGGPEVRNLAYAMDHLSTNQTFDLGMSHWNSLVHTYVPAQLFGDTFKTSLYLDLPPEFPFGYASASGSTSTGMLDAFASFWYFGCLKFLLVGMSLGWIYTAAMRGNTTMQLLYMLSATPGMLVVTHFTNEIVISWVHIAAFVAPVIVFATMRTPRRRPLPMPALSAA
ncbi:hypothetical protein [Mesorhizobium sp. CAU 1732]|uniref:hypothetical protein n=1 Tax=Mesorhizobium sp. CAU 1732 TaxID=3140358 RepID=UPI003261CA9F